jgi:hypothetical protein
MPTRPRSSAPIPPAAERLVKLEPVLARVDRYASNPQNQQRYRQAVGLK